MRSAALPRLTLAAALITLLTGAPALAADPYVSASASITNLRYRLIDLDPTDGIAPSANFIGGAATVQTTLFDTTTNTYVQQISLLNNWPSDIGSVGDSLNGAIITSNSFQASSTISDDNSSAFRTNTWGGPNENYFKTYNQSTTLDSKAQTSPSGGDTTLLIELSANTGIVFEGTASVNAMVDPQSWEAFKAATLADAGPNASEVYAYGNWEAFAGIELSLYGSTPQVGADGSIVRTTLYSLSQNVLASDTTLADVTLQKNHTGDFKVDFWNTENTGTSVHFQFSASTGAWSGLYAQYDITAVPEPGTWALMGLGLAGVALARRRHAV